MNDLVKKIEVDGELLKAFEAIQQPRTNFQLEKFVVGNHDVPEQQYAHCVLEIQVKYNALRKAKISFEKMDYLIAKYKKEADDGNKLSGFKAREKEVEKDTAWLAVVGAIRELEFLYAMWKGFKKKYTREEIDKVQPLYWKKRLERQAHQDVMAGGRIGVGNQEALRQIGAGNLPELDHVHTVEKNFLAEETPKTKVLIVVATEEKAIDGDGKPYLPCIENLIMPSNILWIPYNVYGRQIDEAYNEAAMVFLHGRKNEKGEVGFAPADYMLTVEDDTFPPDNALIKLLRYFQTTESKDVDPFSIGAVGAWYPKRHERREGAPIVIKDGKRTPLEADGEVHEVKSLPMGCTLYSRNTFLQATYPYFATTNILTQDSFFSQKLRDAGYKLYCDTSIRCKHIDRVTSKVYE